MKHKIESDIKVTKPKLIFPYPFSALEIGDSFFVKRTGSTKRIYVQQMELVEEARRYSNMETQRTTEFRTRMIDKDDNVLNGVDAPRKFRDPDWFRKVVGYRVWRII